jgi:hypothetical protein
MKQFLCIFALLVGFTGNIPALEFPRFGGQVIKPLLLMLPV